MGLAAILAKLNGVALFQIVKEMKRRVGGWQEGGRTRHDRREDKAGQPFSLIAIRNGVSIDVELQSRRSYQVRRNSWQRHST
jgi:hypothetical protein